jgi:hypothetical protein
VGRSAGDLPHARTCVEEGELTVGNEMSHHEAALADPPKPFTALEIRQLTPLGDGKAKDVRGVWRLRGLLLVDDLRSA